MTGAWKLMLPSISQTTVVGAGSSRIAWMAWCTFSFLLLSTAHSFSCIAYGSRSYRSFTSLGAITKPTLGLLSFDLDDTLFPTGEVVRSANKVMMARMHRIGCVDETIAGFLENTRSIRKSLNEPITYRDLRKNAIRETLLKSLEFKSSDNLRNIDALVEECYDAWVNERHAAAERFVFDGAVETLRTLRQTYPRVCIAAITNGAGNPFAMSETLEPFFDLRVSGEDDGVFPHRKPHPFIYQYTLQQYGKSNHNDHVWCHVGDCLANDVGASAACGAQAIWMCTGEDEDMAASRLVDTKRVPEWSTASTSELERRAQQVSEGENSMSAKIGRLAELPAAIEAVLQSC